MSCQSRRERRKSFITQYCNVVYLIRDTTATTKPIASNQQSSVCSCLCTSKERDRRRFTRLSLLLCLTWTHWGYEWAYSIVSQKRLYPSLPALIFGTSCINLHYFFQTNSNRYKAHSDQYIDDIYRANDIYRAHWIITWNVKVRVERDLL